MRWPLYLQIFFAMALGTSVGLGLNISEQSGFLSKELLDTVASLGEWMGGLFLSLLKMVVVPLVFSSLVSSLVSMKQGETLKRLGFRTASFYLMTSFLAICTGLLMVNLIRPGEGMDYEALLMASSGAHQPTLPTLDVSGSSFSVVSGVFTRMVPENVVLAATQNGSMLSIVFFALLFGGFSASVGGKTAERIGAFFEAVYEVMMAMTTFILSFAPIGIFGYLLFVTAQTGLSLVSSLAAYLLTVSLALAVHAFITLPAILWFSTGRNPIVLARSMSEALGTAFSTASSSGTLPLTMRCAVEKANVPQPIAAFTLPLGATINMDGTALYEAVAVLFVAQMLGGLAFGQQVIVAITALMVSIGAAGIPHAGTVMMVIVMQAVHLPTDAIMVILSVDRILDMMRTTVNVWSDTICAVVIAHQESQ